MNPRALSLRRGGASLGEKSVFAYDAAVPALSTLSDNATWGSVGPERTQASRTSDPRW